MKKVLITLALLFGFHLLNVNHVQASNYNLFDLQNLHGTTDSLETIEPIEVIEGQMYSLVFSDKFSYKIDLESYYQGSAEIELVFGEDIIKEFKWEGMKHGNSNLIYYEFVALSNSLEIKNIHFDGHAPEVVLIRGNIGSFMGFYFYNETFNKVIQRTITYEEVDDYDPLVYYYIAGNELPKAPTLIHNDLEKEIDQYSIVYRAVENNKSFYLTIEISVIDELAPVLLTDALSYQINEKPDLEQVLSELQIVDNTTTINRSHIKIIEDNYSDAKIPGTYDIKLKISDDYENFIERTVSISLLSDGKLVLEGPMTHFYYKSKYLPTLEEITKLYKAYDPYTNEELNIISSSTSYDRNNITPGNKHIKFEIKDSSGVTHTKYVSVIIIDDTKPVFVYNGVVITLNINVDYNDEEIINLISEGLDEKEVIYYNLSFLKDELDENKINITYVNEDNEIVYDYVTINYYDDNKTTLILATAIGLVVLLTAVYFVVDKRKRNKKLRR